MNIHQVTCMHGNNQIQHRILSCFCTKTKLSCTCYNPTEHTFENVLEIVPQSVHEDSYKTEVIRNVEVDEYDEYGLEETDSQVINNDIQ